MDSIAVTKPNMGVLSQERLALSPFGALAQSFAEELIARAGQEEGYWSFVPLELLQEAEEPPVSPASSAQTVVQLNLKLVLDALRKDRPNIEYLRATERIVERIVQRQEVQREAARSAPAAAAAVAPAATAQAALRFQQNILQTLHQTFLFQRPDGQRTGDGFRQQPGAMTGETGRPGQLGQRAAVFTQMLQTLREEGKSFPAQQSAEQAATPAQRPKYPTLGDQTVPPLTHLEEGEPAAEIAQQGGVQAAKRLMRTAEQLERELRQKDARPTQTQSIQQREHMPVTQHTGPKQGHDLPKHPASQGGDPTGSLHTLETPSLTEQSEIARAVERAARTAETVFPQMETQRQAPAKPLTEQPSGKEERTTTAKDIRTVIPDSAVQGSQPEQHQPGFFPGQELTHRQEEQDSGTTTQPAAMTQPHSAQLHAESDQKVTARDIRTVISESGEQATQPERRLGVDLPGEELTHRQEEQDSGPTTQPAATTPPVPVQPHAEPGRTVTTRYIRTVIPESGKQATKPERRLGEVLPGEEQTHRQEEQESGATTPTTTVIPPVPVQPHVEPGQTVTARDIRTVIPESGEQAAHPEQRFGEVFPGEELTHRQEEQGGGAITPPVATIPPVPVQPHAEPGQTVTAQDIRTVIPESGEQAAQPEQRLGEVLPGEELTHRQEEQGGGAITPPVATIPPVPAQPHAELGQTVTARDIRTVIPESGEQAARPEQRLGEVLPGEELTHRQEEQDGGATNPPVPAQPHAGLGQKVTARDIRTVIPESGEQATQPEERLGEILPSEELTHRQEEQRDGATQPVTQSQTHIGKETHSTASASIAGQENRLYQRKAKLLSSSETNHQKETDTSRTAQISRAKQSTGKARLVTARDIRTAAASSTGEEGSRDQRKVETLSGGRLIHRLEGQSEEHTLPSAANRTIESTLTQGTLSGEELALRTEQGAAVSPTAETLEPPTVGQGASVGQPYAGALRGDIRIGQRLIGRNSLPLEVDGRRDIPPIAVPNVALDYGARVQGQQGGQQTVPARSNTRQAGDTAGQQPLELTYSPGQQAANQVLPPVQPQAPQLPEESDYVRSLPDWARRFLRDSWTAAPAAQEIGVAKQIATLPEQSTEMMEWSAPSYKPNVPLEHREKRKEERPQKPQQIHLSEAEIQRAADRVYRILEDRIREERIRLGF
ncbi:MAG TPA: hypothetical protein H9764_12205 [Candidatus Flavonifractor merdavium]|nr:hypothetical protein [Candidatus Flavonifractor merdavium]